MMSDYHKALQLCAIRYTCMAHGQDSNLQSFIAEFKQKVEEGFPLPKLCRWLGYIQGVLIERTVTTVQTERDWTRPLFRPLDFSHDEG